MNICNHHLDGACGGGLEFEQLLVQVLDLHHVLLVLDLS
jgi:hypothetical protein